MRIRQRIVAEADYLKRVVFLSIAISVVVTFCSSNLHWFEDAELRMIRLFLWWQEKPLSEKIVLVEIDDAAFQSLNRVEPIPRPYLVKLLNAIARGKPRVIGIDLDLSPLPLTKLASPPEEKKLDQELLEETIVNISTAAPVNEHPVRIGLSYALEQDEKTGVYINTEGRDFAKEMMSRSAGIHAGFVNLSEEKGVVRKMATVVQMEKVYEPSFALSTYWAAKGCSASELSRELQPSPRSWFGNIVARIDPILGLEEPGEKFELREDCRSHDGKTFRLKAKSLELINFSNEFEIFPSSDVIEKLSKAPEEYFKDKIVILGVSFKESKDFYWAPHLESKVPGLILIAHSLNTFIEHRRIEPLDFLLSAGVDSLLGIVAGFIFVLAPSGKKSSILATALAWSFAGLVSYPLFSKYSLWVDFIATQVGIKLHRKLHEREQKSEQSGTLSTYKSEELLDIFSLAEQMIQKDSIVLVGRITNLAEAFDNLPVMNAQKVIARLNQLSAKYRQHFTQAQILSNSRIAAFFPAEPPDSFQSVVRSADFLLNEIAELNAECRKFIPSFKPLRVSIGIDYHPRSTVDALGNALELALRAHHLGSEILCTAAFYEHFKGKNDSKPHAKIKTSRGAWIPVFEIHKSHGEEVRA